MARVQETPEQLRGMTGVDIMLKYKKAFEDLAKAGVPGAAEAVFAMGKDIEANIGPGLDSNGNQVPFNRPEMPFAQEFGGSNPTMRASPWGGGGQETNFYQKKLEQLMQAGGIGETPQTGPAASASGFVPQVSPRQTSRIAQMKSGVRSGAAQPAPQYQYPVQNSFVGGVLPDGSAQWNVRKGSNVYSSGATNNEMLVAADGYHISSGDDLNDRTAFGSDATSQLMTDRLGLPGASSVMPIRDALAAEAEKARAYDAQQASINVGRNLPALAMAARGMGANASGVPGMSAAELHRKNLADMQNQFGNGGQLVGPMSQRINKKEKLAIDAAKLDRANNLKIAEAGEARLAREAKAKQDSAVGMEVLRGGLEQRRQQTMALFNSKLKTAEQRADALKKAQPRGAILVAKLQQKYPNLVSNGVPIGMLRDLSNMLVINSVLSDEKEFKVDEIADEVYASAKANGLT